MMGKVRWRFAIGYSLIVIVIMVILGIQLTRPACLAVIQCVRRTLLVGGIWLLVGGGLWGWIVLSGIMGPVRQLTLLSRRVAAGDTQARILPQNMGELYGLVYEFNRMKDYLVDQMATLKDQQQQMSLILEYTADGILITDDMSYVDLINPAAAQLLGTGRKESLGRAFAEVARHHQLIELFQLSQSTQQREKQAFEVSQEGFLQAAITPFRRGEKRGYLVILQDLTAMRRLETVRRDFISNLSHELRTPLASLRAVVETLQGGAIEEPMVAARFLRRALREVDTLTQMVEEVLELSRIESGRVPLQLKETAVYDLILIAMERLRAQAQRNELELQLELPADLPAVLADAPRIQQVVTNLLHNAIKFTPPGGRIRIRAYLSTESKGTKGTEEGEMVVIEVKDSGIGIPAPDLPRIFERFYKSDRARTHGQGGTGLGLAIARHLVEAHNGRIWARSKEGKGSTFYFSLPLAHSYLMNVT